MTNMIRVPKSLNLDPQDNTQDDVLAEEIDDDTLAHQYNEFLDDTYGEVRIGDLSFWPSRIIREIDPTAYRTGMSDFDDFDYHEVDLDDYPEALDDPEDEDDDES